MHQTIPRRALLLAPVVAVAPCLCQAAQRECCTVQAAPASSVRIEPDVITLNLRDVPELRRAGGYVKIAMDEKNDMIVVHSKKDEYHALARKCTHGGGPLTYLHKQRVLHCTCWGHSQFALDGSVITGMATEKLRVYPLTRKGDTLEIQTRAKA
jgi:Rieske Fe-S protein